MIGFYLKNNAYNEKKHAFVQAIKRCISKEMEWSLG